MARKANSFKVNDKEREIIIYSNVEQPPVESNLVAFYLTNGYKPKFEEKKKGKTVSEMRAELKVLGDDKLAEFNRLYKIKADKKDKNSKSGFHLACKYYNSVLKDIKNKENSETENN